MKLLPAVILGAVAAEGTEGDMAPRKYLNKNKFMHNFSQDNWWWNAEQSIAQPTLTKDLMQTYFTTWFGCDDGLERNNKGEVKHNKKNRCEARRDALNTQVGKMIQRVEDLRDGTGNTQCISRHISRQRRSPDPIERGRKNGIYKDKFSVEGKDVKLETDKSYYRLARIIKNIVYYSDDEVCQDAGRKMIARVDRLRIFTMYQWCELYHRHSDRSMTKNPEGRKRFKNDEKMCKDKLIQTSPRSDNSRTEKQYGATGKWLTKWEKAFDEQGAIWRDEKDLGDRK